MFFLQRVRSKGFSYGWTVIVVVCGGGLGLGYVVLVAVWVEVLDYV